MNSVGSALANAVRQVNAAHRQLSPERRDSVRLSPAEHLLDPDLPEREALAAVDSWRDENLGLIEAAQ